MKDVCGRCGRSFDDHIYLMPSGAYRDVPECPPEKKVPA